MDNKFKGKKVLIFGLGLNQGGVGSAQFFAKQRSIVKVTDLKSKEILKPSLEQLKEFRDISYTLGKHNYKDIDWADLIIKNQAVKPGNPYIEYARGIGKQVETDMGIFLRYVKPEQLIGVTGTKGKSTTASLIYEMLKAAGKNAILAGNIGRSVLELIPIIQKPIFPPRGWKAKSAEDLIILELSSFQLEAFETYQLSPKWAVITNIYQDHLNYYQTMNEYIAAKKVIANYQKRADFLFINRDDPTLNNPKFLRKIKSRIIFYSSTDLPEDFLLNLPGNHNRANLAAALALGKALGIKEQIILNSLASFESIPFRMEAVKTWQGFQIYNDSTATNPAATISALKTFGPQTEDQEPNIILICGGMNKNIDYSQLGDTIDQSAKAVYFLEGDVVDEIICAMPDKSIIEGRFSNLKYLLKKLKTDIQTRGLYGDIKKKGSYFKKGDIILFSPGATSFNLFQNEFDRGRQFNRAVEKVFGVGIS